MFFKKPSDTGQSVYKDLRHFVALQIRWREDKCSHACLHERQPFHMSVSDAMVLGQDDPTMLSDLSKPDFILGIRGKVIIVDMDRSTGLAERCSYALFPQRTIEEENGLFKRLRWRVRT